MIHMSAKNDFSSEKTELNSSQSGVDVKDQIHPRWADRISVIDAAQAPVNDHSNVIALGTGLASDKLLGLACNSGLQHIVQDSPDQETELNTAALMISEPETFLSYPLSSIL